MIRVERAIIHGIKLSQENNGYPGQGDRLWKENRVNKNKLIREQNAEDHNCNFIYSAHAYSFC